MTRPPIQRSLSSSLCATLLLAAGCTKQAPPPSAPPPPLVTVAQPLQREIVEWDEYTGRTEAVQTVEVRARVSGYLQSVHFKDGALVKAGDLLFQLDARPYQADLDKAEADLEQAKTQLTQMTREAERVQTLASSGAMAAEEIEQRRNRSQMSAAAVRSSEAAVAAMRLNVEYTHITAAISGRAGRRMITEGNVVNSGPFNGTLLTTIVSIDPLYCYIDADERAVLKYVQLARDGERTSARDEPIPAQIAFGNETDFPHEGVVDFVDNHIDPTTGTLRARAVIPNPDGRLIPGLFARVRLPGSAKHSATLISDEAIGTDQSQRFVYVVDDSGMVRYRRIVPGARHEGLRIVREGLKPDDWVIVNGMAKVHPEMAVKVQKKSLDEPKSNASAPVAPSSSGAGSK